MTDSILIAIIVALPPTLTALAAFKQGIKISKKTDEIHELTNSNLTSIKAELAIANQEIADLKKFIAKE